MKKVQQKKAVKKSEPQNEMLNQLLTALVTLSQKKPVVEEEEAEEVDVIEEKPKKAVKGKKDEKPPVKIKKKSLSDHLRDFLVIENDLNELQSITWDGENNHFVAEYDTYKDEYFKVFTTGSDILPIFENAKKCKHINVFAYEHLLICEYKLKD